MTNSSPVMSEIRRSLIQWEMEDRRPTKVRMDSDTYHQMCREETFRSVWDSPEQAISLIGVVRVYGMDVVVDESCPEMSFE